jgi:hypothetical protein
MKSMMTRKIRKSILASIRLIARSSDAYSSIKHRKSFEKKLPQKGSRTIPTEYALRVSQRETSFSLKDMFGLFCILLFIVPTAAFALTGNLLLLIPGLSGLALGLSTFVTQIKSGAHFVPMVPDMNPIELFLAYPEYYCDPALFDAQIRQETTSGTDIFILELSSPTPAISRIEIPLNPEMQTTGQEITVGLATKTSAQMVKVISSICMEMVIEREGAQTEPTAENAIVSYHKTTE